MAMVKRVRKLVNPRTRKAKGKHKRKGNPKHRRRLSAAQKAAGFGGKRAKAAVRGGRKRHAKRSRPKSNPSTRTKTRVVTKTKWRTRKVYVKAKAHRKRSRGKRNPAGLLVTYGPAINPRKRRKSVAKTRKKKNPRTRTRVITKIRYRTRGKKNPHHRGRKAGHRNPGGFGSMKDMGTAVVGGLVGVTITKTIPSLLPATMLSSGLMRIVVSAAVAWGAGMLGGKFVGPEFGKYVLFGGLMQAGSVALNTFIPSIGSAIGLQGLVPSNDILLPYNMFQGKGAMLSSPGTMSRGSGSGFAPAFA